jgi:hypothetical protein
MQAIPVSSGLGTAREETYHVSLQILFLLLLETLQVFEDTGASIFDVLLGDFECCFELDGSLVDAQSN